MGTVEKIDVPEYLLGENQCETVNNVKLYEAASKGDLSQLQQALKAGANPNFFYHKMECSGVLHAAARNLSNLDFESARCAKELITKGARVSATIVSNLNTPIHEAATAGSEEVCRTLIEASPECTEHENSFGNTALHAATRSGHFNIVQLLLNHSADPNKTNHRGSTALHIACFLASNSSDCVDVESLSAGEKCFGQNSSVDPYLIIVVILLCNEKTIIDIQDINGYTALHVAAQRGCNNLVKLLINSGADTAAKTAFDSRGRGGRTPAGMARFGGYETTAAIIEKFTDAAACGENVASKNMVFGLEWLALSPYRQPTV